MKTKTLISSLSFAGLLILVGCGGNASSESAAADKAASARCEASILEVEQVLLAEAPEGPIQPLASVRTGGTYTPGDPVRVEGRIGGVEKPFTEGYALFIMADESLMFCDEMTEVMHCPTPWDACCEDPDKRRSMLALVQVVDSDGVPLEASLKGLGNLSENDSVVVTGVVDAASNSEKLVINASGIFRKGP